jgi:predicted ester cyclase
MVAEGDKVAIRYTWKATHTGTGKKIAVKGMEIDRISAGKIAEIWELLDSQSMMTQLGIVPGAVPKT